MAGVATFCSHFQRIAAFLLMRRRDLLTCDCHPRCTNVPAAPVGIVSAHSCVGDAQSRLGLLFCAPAAFEHGGVRE